MVKDNDFGISLEQAVNELSTEIEQGVNFIFSEFGDDWETAERYYAGGTDLPTVEGRSAVVKTEVRDSIRALKPNVMRAFLHGRKPVEYVPNTVASGLLAEQQSLFAAQLFWQNGGYKALLNMTEESMKKKIGPVKTYFEENPFPDMIKATGLTEQDLDLLEQSPDVEIEEIRDHSSPLEGDMPTVPLYDVDFYRYYTNGRIRIEAFPAVEFFANRNATGIHDAVVHGHRRDVTVGEAIAMGLDYDDWFSLDPDDPEMNEHMGESHERRRYQKHSPDDLDSEDVINHLFLLTECYAEFDLKGNGSPQKYVFYLAGTSYVYLDHEEIEDWEIDLAEVDPVAFALMGRSIADLTIHEQDFNTSILRSIGDNFHISNNPRPFANPMLVDFNDLMNDAIGAPIKVKQGGDIGTWNIPFTGQQGIPFLQYLEQDVENKVGVTKAAQGLDPDAMQSTDKDAVRNTIALGQGQTEFIVRNLIETALIPIFKKLLRLSIRHFDAQQVVRMKGQVVPVNQALINPDLMAEPNVGLGTASPEQKMAGLQFILQKQEQILTNFGLDNPMVSLSNIYNTLEDITELSGFYDVGRFFNVVTPEIERRIAEQKAAEAAQAAKEGKDNMPMDPAKALMITENMKSRTKQMEIIADKEASARKHELDAQIAASNEDLKRDQMNQDKVIALLKIQEEGRAKRADARIKREQNANNRDNMIFNSVRSMSNAEGGQSTDQTGASGPSESSQNSA